MLGDGSGGDEGFSLIEVGIALSPREAEMR